MYDAGEAIANVEETEPNCEKCTLSLNRVRENKLSLGKRKIKTRLGNQKTNRAQPSWS